VASDDVETVYLTPQDALELYAHNGFSGSLPLPGGALRIGVHCDNAYDALAVTTGRVTRLSFQRTHTLTQCIPAATVRALR
jgi:hypothetical protein